MVIPSLVTWEGSAQRYMTSLLIEWLEGEATGYPPRSRKFGMPATVMKGGERRVEGSGGGSGADILRSLMIDD